MEPIWALGLMSGTSLDGVDAAWLRTDGDVIYEKGEGFMVPYPSDLRTKLRAILGESQPTAEIRNLEKEMTDFQGDVVKIAQKQKDFQLIGFHGQTIFHAPPHTWQIGDGVMLSEKGGVDVVYDFRTLDVKRGGQGAPLVPIFHQAILEQAGLIKEKAIAIANIGGVANITWIQKDHPLIACDTGPGGALLDDWLFKKIGKLFDKDGYISAQGNPQQDLVQKWLQNPYFTKPAPKSLDRDAFAKLFCDIEGLSVEDGAATLVEFTAQTLTHGLHQMPQKPVNLYVSGGGRLNQTLMRRLQILGSWEVLPIENLGWSGDLLEAYAFAYLAVRVKQGLPTSFPTTTGVSQPTCGGIFCAYKHP